MNIAIYVTSSTLVILLFQCVGSIFRSHNHSDLSINRGFESFVFGFMLWTICVSIQAILFPSIVTKFSLPVTLLLAILFAAGRLRQHFQIGSLAVFLLLPTVIFMTVGELRFHASPDIHGLAATVSFFTDHPSFLDLQAKFQTFSGSDLPIVDGLRTPDLNSTWNVGDARLRFASDHVLTVGRLGIALVLAIPGRFAFLEERFLHGTYLLGALGSISLCYLACEIFRTVRFYGCQRKSSAIAHSSLLVILLAFSPMSLLMILEGAVIQIWVLVALAAQELFLLRIIDRRNFTDKRQTFSLVIRMSVCPMFLAVTYPQSLLVLAVISGVTCLLALSISEPTIAARLYLPVVISLSLFLAGATAWWINRYTFLIMAEKFLSGGTGAPYNPGFLSMSSSLLQFGSSLEFTQISTPGSGFAVLLESRRTALIQCSIVGFLTVISLIRLFIKRAWLPLTSVVLLLNLVFLIPVFRTLTEIPALSSYFYIRYLQTYLAIAFPMLLGLAFASTESKRIQ